MAELRSNRVKHRLAQGEVVLVLTETDPDAVESLSGLGFVDGFRLDMEHDTTSWGDLRHYSRACDLWNVTSLARVESGEPVTIGKTLDQGIQGVIVPHVTTPEAAEAAVRGAKYPPEGSRGFTTSRQGIGVTDYFRHANDELFVAVMVEDIEGIGRLGEILGVEHIDCFIVAPGDLSASMGPQYLGNLHHPDVRAVMARAIEQIVAAGRVAGTHLEDDDQLDVYLKLGARFFWTSPHRYVRQGLRNLAGRLPHPEGTRAGSKGER